MDPIDPALLYGPFYISSNSEAVLTSPYNTSNIRVADEGAESYPDWNFDNQTFASDLYPINPNNPTPGEGGPWDTDLQEFNPDLFNTFGRIEPPSTDGNLDNPDMISSSVVVDRETSGQYIGQHIVPSSSSTVGDCGQSDYIAFHQCPSRRGSCSVCSRR